MQMNKDESANVRECSLILWWGGWAIENFCRQTFLTPPSQAARTF